jgi:protein SCO1/2
VPCCKSVTQRWVLAAGIFLLTTAYGWAGQKYDVRGLVLKVDAPRKNMLVSCESIPGYMEAMTMPFTVRESGMLEGLKPGTAVEFTLVVDDDSSYADNVRARAFESLELDPTQARRMRILEKTVAPTSSLPGALAVGQAVPDFALTDQNHRRVTLSQFAGKVVAVTFIYTRCPFPNYCFRLSNNFGQLQKRFKEKLGRDLVLLSIVIDPANDGADALTKYARIWKADSDGWHFLTGPLPEIQQVAGKFDMNFYPDEALLVHSFHTAVIDRQSRLAANLEGNEFTGQQLGDLVETLLNQSN